MTKWYEASGEPVFVSTRVRLARNLGNVPFPDAMNEKQMAETNRLIADTLCNGNSALAGELRVVEMEKLPEAEVLAMVERHIISPVFAKNRADRLLVLSKDESISIMLGEEDHIRIQVLLPGLKLTEAYDTADKIDTLLAEELPIAFDPELGYLTECPTNLGTGMRASVMMHLPALENNREIAGLSESVGKIGLTVRGTYGEGSGSDASLYQLSNQVTLGVTERAALQNLQSIARQIAGREKQARELLDADSLADSVWRAWGTLKNARLLESKEMPGLVSRVKLGIDCGILPGADPAMPIRLLIETQPAMLQTGYGTATPRERDRTRAEIFRTRLR